MARERQEERQYDVRKARGRWSLLIKGTHPVVHSSGRKVTEEAEEGGVFTCTQLAFGVWTEDHELYIM